MKDHPSPARGALSISHVDLGHGRRPEPPRSMVVVCLVPAEKRNKVLVGPKPIASVGHVPSFQGTRPKTPLGPTPIRIPPMIKFSPHLLDLLDLLVLHHSFGGHSSPERTSSCRQWLAARRPQGPTTVYRSGHIPMTRRSGTPIQGTSLAVSLQNHVCWEYEFRFDTEISTEHH